MFPAKQLPLWAKGLDWETYAINCDSQRVMMHDWHTTMPEPSKADPVISSIMLYSSRPYLRITRNGEI
jgi:hypothetical protein